jgi:peptidoglycan/LPS O-acetylase OafA/YrhL
MGAVAATAGKTASASARRAVAALALIAFAIYAVVTFEAAFNMLRFLSVEGIFGLWPYYWLFDVLIGIVAALFLWLAGTSIAAGRPGILVRALSSRLLLRLGVASYSLYLIHDPVLAVVKIPLDRLHFGPWQQFASMLLFGGTAVGLATWIFHLLCERPFMPAARVAAVQ